MSKIRLTGSNSGYVEIASAADAGNLTFVLPTSGTSLLGNGHNVYTGITTFTNDFKLEGGSYDVLWDASDNQLEFDDNAKLSFGASSDLSIYHDDHSRIVDTGTGNLKLQGSKIQLLNADNSKEFLHGLDGGGVTLRHNNNVKLVTESGGVTVTGTLTATTFAPTSEQLSHRNIAINGDMRVAQRGTSTTISTGNNTNASGVYTVDRMKLGCYVGSERYTLSQETDAPTGSGFTKSFKIKTSTADTSANAGTYAQFVYQIEGQDLQHLLKGTSSAKPLTFSFWVKGNTNYTPVAELKDNSNVRINVQTFNVTTSWTKVVLTYVGDTTGTIDDDNTAGLTFNIWLKAAAFYSGGTSPAQNTWVPQSNHNIRAALLTFDIATSTDNYFQITGLQIEVGSIATPFEHRSFAEELARCQRYYYVIGDARDSGTTFQLFNCHAYSTGQFETTVHYPVMRATPSLVQGTGTGFMNALNASGTITFNSWILYHPSTRVTLLYQNNNLSSNPTTGSSYRAQLANNNAYVHLDAEL